MESLKNFDVAGHVEPLCKKYYFQIYRIFE